MATSVYLKSLPVEIQILILEWLTTAHDREVLKACRLVDRAFSDAATVALFHTLHLSTSILSVQRLEQVAKTPRLAQHVRQLVFHRGTWEIPDGASALEGDFDSWPQNGNEDAAKFSRFCLGQPCTHAAPLDHRIEQNLVEFVLDEFYFQQGRYRWWELLQTWGRSNAFPNLHHVKIAGIRKDDISEYHFRRTEHYQLRRSYLRFPFHMILTATQYFPVRLLDAQEVLADLALVDMLGMEPESITNYFEKLEILNIDWDRATPAIHNNLDHVSRLTDLQLGIRNLFSKPFCHLRKLSFSYGARNVAVSPWPTRFEQLRISRILMGQTFPKLEEIDLTLCTIDESVLLDFLANHKSTLKTLRIKDWAMPTPAPPLDDPATEASFPNCFIRTIWKIPQISDLDHIQLAGVLHSFSTKTGCKFNWNWKVGPKSAEEDRGGNMETFSRGGSPLSSRSSSDTASAAVTTTSHEPSILSRLEDYLCHRGPFPFSPALLHALEDDDRHFAKLPLTFDEDGNPCSFDCHFLVTEHQDPSWQFVVDERPEYLPNRGSGSGRILS